MNELSPVANYVLSAASPQAFKVLLMMERNDFSITAREAMMDLDMTSATLSRRICDLEDLGVRITREQRKNPMSGKRYTRYFFDPLVLRFIDSGSAELSNEPTHAA